MQYIVTTTHINNSFDREILLNVQTERLDNHIARLTVAIETERLDSAKKKAAKKLANSVNIPGFRKGKVPYRILVSYVGEGPILEQAVEDIGNDVYRNALEESEIEPYTSGELEDFQLSPQPTFVFTVPMRPTVELNDYDTVRVNYEMPTVDDADVDEALHELQQEHALVEESSKPAKMGDRVSGDLHGFFQDEEDENDEVDADDADVDEGEIVDEDDTDDADTSDDYDDEDEGYDFSEADIHDHDVEIYLDEDREPVPGFAEALVGVEAGETREFTITYPDDEEYGDLAGRDVLFVMDVEMVENVTLPALNDDFAARVTEEVRKDDEQDDEDEVQEPLTLLELRARLRENLQEETEQQYRSEYIDKVMSEMVERADFAYPEAMIREQIDSIAEDMAERFQVSLEDYLNLMQKDMEDLYEEEEFRESAELYIQQSLVMRGVVEMANLEVDDESIEEEIGKFISQFGGGAEAEQFRGLFDSPQMRESIVNRLLQERVLDQLVLIGRGEATAAADDDDTTDDGSDDAAQPVADADNEVEEPEPVETDES